MFLIRASFITTVYEHGRLYCIDSFHLDFFLYSDVKAKPFFTP